MPKTSIEWTDVSWPVLNGCRRVSPGCQNCYAERLAATRLRRTEKYRGLATYTPGGPRWSGESRLWPKELSMPLRLRKPSRIFVCDMGDLFFEGNSNEQIAAIFGVMAECPQHRFQVLTKRAKRMREWFAWYEGTSGAGASPYAASEAAREVLGGTLDRYCPDPAPAVWPLPNVWLGVSAEDQQRADERIPELLRTPADVRFVSAEPLLGPISFRDEDWTTKDYLRGVEYDPRGRVERPLPARLDWVIVGGESGPKARPCNVERVRSIVSQCRAAGVACFVKQLGRFAYVDKGGRYFARDIGLSDKKGGDMSEWPGDLRVREFPEVRR